MQTAKRSSMLSTFMISIQISLDFHSHFTNTMSLVPMYFSKPYRTIGKAHIGNAFALSPTPLSEPLAQLAQFSDRVSKSDCLGVGNISEEFKIYLHGSRYL